MRHCRRQEQPGEQGEPGRARERGAEISAEHGCRHDQERRREHRDHEVHRAARRAPPHEQAASRITAAESWREREVALAETRIPIVAE